MTIRDISEDAITYEILLAPFLRGESDGEFLKIILKDPEIKEWVAKTVKLLTAYHVLTLAKLREVEKMLEAEQKELDVDA